jgi:hypothetical protein
MLTTEENPPVDGVEASALAALDAARAAIGTKDDHDVVMNEIAERVTPPTLKELLLRRRLGTAHVAISGLEPYEGVTIRALTKIEAKTLRFDKQGKQVSNEHYENLLIAAALVDPVLTIHEVELWAECAPAGEHVRVMTAIQLVSGLGEDSSKSGVPEVRD